MAQFRYRINQTDWIAGYNTGEAGQPDKSPVNVDGLSWSSGYIEGKAAGRINSNLESAATLANEINQEVKA
ncbi:hypothetical protein [Desulfobacter postgatei]|uniref:Uncharacterized protein n=1 Tax=Desulfobacter postgatei 2ac9 TaxID=879212 RepID=I5B174_9BACT|nr:hypothetical protein [Desulfobacter postgatei]EIM63237.1 hypothetical protein DespoDRAFT_01277 [Desulfobacter postgatei 2ac9]